MYFYASLSSYKLLPASQVGQHAGTVGQHHRNKHKIQNENDVYVLNNHKNNSLYVGIKDGKFLEPSDFISKEMAIDLRTNVLIRLGAAKTILREMLIDLDNIIGLIKVADHALSDEERHKFFYSFFND